ncbi:DUF1801 domain-containing protein [Emticicia sp. C21]|uniref:DUF1801 domain-containing protein n=1 Tax=Emticicia sp. C21 TaxID=2302915 RepID=UPI000E347733|nr:DUF1801 domain-containing protein [Emticicia sp. C21]RFS16519.1 DUF1801 domain-containing protein [Emticicia sp. C21]
MDIKISDFLANYNEVVYRRAVLLRSVILDTLPNVIEQLDVPAKMVAYCYGQKYAELICMLIPSKKGLKLGFNRGVDLTDPRLLLEGTGKISRYIEIKHDGQVQSPALKALLESALEAYKKRMGI